MNKEQQLAELELTIKKAQQQIEELNKPKAMFERSHKGGNYYCIDDRFYIKSVTDYDQYLDEKRYKSANYYLEKDKHIAERVANMTTENGRKFKAWLEEYKPNGI